MSFVRWRVVAGEERKNTSDQENKMRRCSKGEASDPLVFALVSDAACVPLGGYLCNVFQTMMGILLSAIVFGCRGMTYYLPWPFRYISYEVSDINYQHFCLSSKSVTLRRRRSFSFFFTSAVWCGAVRRRGVLCAVCVCF